MVYTHYLKNGEMEDDWNFLDAHGPTGVGQYDATWERIEAEWFMVGSHIDKLQVNEATNNTNAAFAVRFINASSTLVFPNVANLPVQGTLILELAQRESHAEGLQRARGILAVYAQTKDGSGSRGPQLASCSLTGRARVTCPLDSHEVWAHSSSRDRSSTRSSSIDMMFVFQPPPVVGESEASEVDVQLDNWSVLASI